MNAKYPLGIPTMRPGFSPETRADCGVAQRQVRLINNIVIVKRQKRVFSCRNQVEIFSLDLIDHFFKVGERDRPAITSRRRKYGGWWSWKPFFATKSNPYLMRA